VVLPENAAEWPNEQKESVLLHEIAHIARWDYPIHLAVEIAKALYWPNPLVWLASRRCAMERERACDDYALRGGAPSDRYASHLIEIARAQLETAPLSATTMAGEPGIFERIRHVMNETLDRSPIRLARLALVVAVAFALTLPLATMKVLRADDWHVPATGALVGELRESDDAQVRRRSAWWLGEHEDTTAVPALVAALEDDNADVRLVAAWALGEIKHPGTIEPLARTLENDNDFFVREMAALALGEIGHSEAVGPLMKAFKSEDELRLAVIWALGEVEGDEASVARAVAFGKMGEKPWQNGEVWAPSRDENFDDVTFEIDELLQGTRSNDSQERYTSTVLLGVLGRVDGIDDVETVVDVLMDMLRDPVPQVRAVAVWSLDETNPSRSMRNGDRHTETSLTEHRMNSLGYVFLKSYRFEQAIEIFKANARLHPDSWNVYDSLGEAYMKMGEVELSIENYEKSVELNPDNEVGVKMLEILNEFN
jgi:tetratricopeptide (TPR) repeat protein